MDGVWGKGGHNRGHACMRACVRAGMRDMRKQKGVERSRQSRSVFVRAANGSERVAMPGAAKEGKGVCGSGGRENERLRPTVRIYDENRGSVRGSVTSTLTGLLHAMSMWNVDSSSGGSNIRAFILPSCAACAMPTLIRRLTRKSLGCGGGDLAVVVSGSFWSCYSTATDGI